MKKLLFGLSVLAITFANCQDAVLTRSGIELTVYNQHAADSISAVLLRDMFSNLVNKVDIQRGMGLSQANYTMDEKTKLASLSQFASFDPSIINPLLLAKVDKINGWGLSENNLRTDDLNFLHGINAGIGGTPTNLSFSGNLNIGGDNSFAAFDGNQGLGFVKSASAGGFLGIMAYGSSRSFGIYQSNTSKIDPTSNYVNRFTIGVDGSVTIPNLANPNGGFVAVDVNGRMFRTDAPSASSGGTYTNIDDDFGDLAPGQFTFNLSDLPSGAVAFFLNGVKISKVFVTNDQRSVTYSGQSIEGTDHVSIVYITTPQAGGGTIVSPDHNSQ